MHEDKRVKPKDDHADFVMSFVDQSREKRDTMEDIWEEVEQNFLVRPYDDAPQSHNTAWPFVGGRSDIRVRRRSGTATLKDPESHQEVMTIVGKLVTALFSEPGFIRARGVGFEDIFKAKTVSELMEYVHRLPGHYKTLVEWIMNTCIYGKGVIKGGWYEDIQPRNFRSVGFDPITGQQFTDQETLLVPVYDDVRLRVLDIRDCFPDPGQTLLGDMRGFADRSKISAAEARADDNYDQAVVERAIESQWRDVSTKEREDKPANDPDRLNPVKESHPDFMMLDRLEYFGEVPFKTSDKMSRRVITVIGGETARSESWPRGLPYFDCEITPRPGSWYGIGVCETIRFDQDFADTLKGRLADAVIRSTNPPPIYDKNADVDTAKLRRYDPNVPIGVVGSPDAAISFVKYNPNLGPTFALYSGVKQQMREASGALDVLQGLGPNKSHTSATAFAGQREEALSRPEMFAQIIEREFMPPIARFCLGLYQEVLEDDEDLRRRIGESNTIAVLADILPEFDIEYVGSRIEGGRNQKLAAFREIVQASAHPIIGQLVPYIPLIRKYFDEMGAPEIAAMVGNEELVKLNAALTQVAVPQAGGPQQQGGNGNGEVAAQAPVGLLPAQEFGGTQ